MKTALRGLLAAAISLGTWPAAAQDQVDAMAVPRVRATTEEVRELIQAGTAASSTFRRLVAELESSDVIVYVEPKLTHKKLGGYLSHSIVTRGEQRYLRVAIEIAGPQRSRVPILAHELQHAVEVSRVRDVRDADGLERLFTALAIPHGCTESRCFETEAAIAVEKLVKAELTAARRDQRLRLIAHSRASWFRRREALQLAEPVQYHCDLRVDRIVLPRRRLPHHDEVPAVGRGIVRPQRTADGVRTLDEHRWRTDQPSGIPIEAAHHQTHLRIGSRHVEELTAVARPGGCHAALGRDLVPLCRTRIGANVNLVAA